MYFLSEDMTERVRESTWAMIIQGVLRNLAATWH